MDKVREKEEELELLDLDDKIADKRVGLAEKKAIVKEAKKKYGRDWKKVLGSLKPNQEAIQTLYAADPNLRELTRPNDLRRL